MRSAIITVGMALTISLFGQQAPGQPPLNFPLLRVDSEFQSTGFFTIASQGRDCCCAGPSHGHSVSDWNSMSMTDGAHVDPVEDDTYAIKSAGTGIHHCGALANNMLELIATTPTGWNTTTYVPQADIMASAVGQCNWSRGDCEPPHGGEARAVWFHALNKPRSEGLYAAGGFEVQPIPNNPTAEGRLEGLAIIIIAQSNAGNAQLIRASNDTLSTIQRCRFTARMGGTEIHGIQDTDYEGWIVDGTIYRDSTNGSGYYFETWPTNTFSHTWTCDQDVLVGQTLPLEASAQLGAASRATDAVTTSSYITGASLSVSFSVVERP